MFLETLSDQTRKALEKLDNSPFNQQTSAYLAGGTGLAIHLGHRFSYDLDFFTQKDFHVDNIVQLVSQLGRFKLEQTGWKTILGKLGDTKFSLFYYQYPIISPLKRILNNTSLTSLEDLAAMKLSAISQRGTKRDFIDLYFLSNHFSLEEMTAFYDHKYQNLSANKTHLLKSLIYFADAEKEPLPEMIAEVNWDQVKRFFEKEVRKLTKEFGLR